MGCHNLNGSPTSGMLVASIGLLARRCVSASSTQAGRGGVQQTHRAGVWGGVIRNRVSSPRLACVLGCTFFHQLIDNIFSCLACVLDVTFFLQQPIHNFFIFASKNLLAC